MELNPKIPFYYQIKEDILGKIERNKYSPGDQLPPEISLAEEYGVSRPTVRQAIVELVQEGILIRGRGKGTFVSEPMIDDNAQVFTTFIEPKDAHHYYSKVIGHSVVPARRKIAEELSLSEGEAVCRIVALLLNDNEKLALRTLQIPEKYAPDMDDIPDLEFVYDRLKELHGIVPTGAVQSFHAVLSNEDEADLLGIAEGSPMTLWQGVLHSSKQPFMHVTTLFRGDRFKFYVVQGDVAKPSSKIASVGTGIIPSMDGL